MQTRDKSTRNRRLVKSELPLTGQEKTTMTTHNSVAISGHDLLGRVMSASDTPWRDVIGWNCDQLDRLEAIAEPTEDEESLRDKLDSDEKAAVRFAWFVVSWPEHVLAPRFNSDATYHLCASEANARESADAVYGE